MHLAAERPDRNGQSLSLSRTNSSNEPKHHGHPRSRRSADQYLSTVPSNQSDKPQASPRSP